MDETEMMRKYAEAHGCGELRIPKLTDEQIKQWQDAMEREPGRLEVVTDYPQAHEKNEYRYLSPAWLDEIARGLTAGQEKYPGETWREIPAKEHAWRAVRHLMLYLKGDKADTHLVNASMRCMMCFETDVKANDVIEWEKLMREKGCS
jgi:hypothetical protein